MRLALILALALSSCGGKKSPPATTAESTSAGDAQPLTRTAILSEMHGNLTRIHDAHSAVIQADLAEVQAAAGDLERIPSIDGFPEPWIDKQMDLQMAAGYARRSETIEDAASRVVAIGVRCAKCHTHVGDGPQFRVSPEPPDAGALQTHMRHHVWGADLMWKGVIAPNPELFQRGAAGLAAAHPEEDEGRAAEIKSIESLLHTEAGEAAKLTDPEAQAKAYGQILARCATCHKAAGVQPALVFSPMLDE